jgi:GT2 family glycosyltransferase
LREAGVAGDALLITERTDVRTLNAGIQHGARPFVCVLDAAIRPESTGTIAALFRLMHEHDADLAAPKLIAEDGTIVWANPRFEDGNRPVSDGLDARGADESDRVTDAAWVSEKAMIARREVVRAVGGLDEGYDDVPTALVDFSLRARQRKFKCTYLGAIAFTCTTTDAAPNAASLDRLRLKWAAYPDLFA